MKYIVWGWILCAQHFGVIAWYESETDCAKAASHMNIFSVHCVPDRFSINEVQP